MLSSFRNVLSWMGRQVLPLRCLVCADPGHEGLDLCAACYADLPWNDHACPLCALPLPPEEPAAICGACLRQPPRQMGAAATFIYAPPIDRLVLRFKFHQDLAAGRLLSQLMLQAVPEFALDPLMPMPLHRRRLRERGYDQARELARPLARELGVPLWSGLCRSRATVAQSTLDAEARRQNLRGAFAVTATPPSRLTLVDDVMTTGATLDGAMRALKRSGMEQATLWVCARAP
ncbi:ComF family protein [Stenotrophomonas sp. VV52]|uniref:ComF family protein n=1 Tax=Stenotrophomonas sp. VV52 TaxID=2066958 RepID=UPI000C9DD813|nr:ComF family protein [Stenotrophomonas sp. VV52]